MTRFRQVLVLLSLAVTLSHSHSYNTEERYGEEGGRQKSFGCRVCATTNLQGVLFFEIGVNYTENVFLMVFRRVEILDLVVEYIFCAVMTQKIPLFCDL